MSYKQLINFDNYYIYDDGRIYSIKVKRFLKPTYTIDRYLKIELRDNNKKRKYFRVHRLVYEAFNGEIPEGYEIDHINGFRDDNRLENLRMLTKLENKQIKHHLEIYKEVEKIRYIKNKDKKKEYYQKHKEEIKIKDKERYMKNKEKIKIKNKEYRKNHKEEINEYQQKYREDHREEIRRKQRERYNNKKINKQD